MRTTLCLAALSVALSMGACSTAQLAQNDEQLSMYEVNLGKQIELKQLEADRLMEDANKVPADAPERAQAFHKAAVAQATVEQLKTFQGTVAQGRKQIRDLQQQSRDSPVDPTGGAGATLGTIAGGPVGGALATAILVGLPLLIKNRKLLAAGESIIVGFQHLINSNPVLADAIDANAATLNKVQTPLAQKMVDDVQSKMAKDGQMPIVSPTPAPSVVT